MAYDFPSSPTNGQVYNGYQFSTATNAWLPITNLGVVQVNGTVTTASTSSGVVRNIYTSTSTPSGGMDGDVWLQYV